MKEQTKKRIHKMAVAAERVMIKRYLRKHDISFSNQDSTETLSKLVRLSLRYSNEN